MTRFELNTPLDVAVQNAEELRVHVKALLELLDNIDTASQPWHKRVSDRVDAISRLYPTTAFAEARDYETQIVDAVRRTFRTFGGDIDPSGSNNPIVHALAGGPVQFAAGVDVHNVVRFILIAFNEIARQWQRPTAPPARKRPRKTPSKRRDGTRRKP